MIYTNKRDSLTDALNTRSLELSNRLVNLISEILNRKYKNLFSQIDVDYKRIYGQRDFNYGDFDLVFCGKEINELFLIEIKHFSDSLNLSGMITDYDKLLKSDKHYDKYRRKYDLVINVPRPIKNFIGASGSVKVHFIFLTSKPIEISF